MNEQENIDSRKALQWLDGDERMLARIRDIFVRNIPPQMERLRACLDANDIVTAERLSHSIKGSAAMVGAVRMSDEAGKIEQSAIERDMDALWPLYAQLNEEYEKVMADLAAEGRKDENPGGR